MNIIHFQVQSESTSPEEVELNSATEISTDSEFENDEIIRETPKIFIDDTHLRRPTKVQVKSTVIASTAGHKYNNAHSKGSYLPKTHVQPQPPHFKPLVQVDPSVLNTNRVPLQNPRPGDYLLNKTASTEGIASKKSLELKKRYLLGEPPNGNKIQKSGSTSVLDSRIRSFQSNISECQKLLNPGSGMKTSMDRTKLGENANNDLMRSATSSILNDLKVEITIEKASSTASTDNEKENVFVNSKNELNKGMEYSETVNTTLLDNINKKSPTTPTNNQTIIETIDLVTPEKQIPELALKKTDINIKVESVSAKPRITANSSQLDVYNLDNNKVIDLTCESPVKSDETIIEEIKPDISKDVKESIPDILGHIENEATYAENNEEHQKLLNYADDKEKGDTPEKLDDQYETNAVQIEVPNIPWSSRKTENISSTSTDSSCSSSIEDIQHYMLDSATSPETNASGLSVNHRVPRLEIHDSSGALMQIDSLMIGDGVAHTNAEDQLQFIDTSESVTMPEVAVVKTSEIEDEVELETEPVTATPEPAECTVIEAADQPPPLPEQGPPLPKVGPPNIKTSNLKFDTKNENKVESLKNLPLIVDQFVQHTKAVKPVTLNLSSTQKPLGSPTKTTASFVRTHTSPVMDIDKTPTADLMSTNDSDSETELTGTGQVLTDTELSDWTADDCISENFVDMEFVLNSNKGTIKRNKKVKKKLESPNLPSTSEIRGAVVKSAPVAEFEGSLQCIDIDDIEFMDTGSEESCAEAYCATNAAMLRNRGYIEFVETTPSHKITKSLELSEIDKAKNTGTKRDDKLGVDYIEQGAYIMQNEDDQAKTPINDNLKTPINESPIKESNMSSSIMNQSLTDSSTFNDVDEESLFVVTPISQIQLSSATNTTNTTKTTTEESDALTIVTSPLESYSPKAPRVLNADASCSGATELSTPSSSDKNPKTSQSTCNPSSTSSSKSASAHRSAHNTAITPVSSAIENSGQYKHTDELCYEEYVRALQHRIAQISTARDSLDSRKQRRKSSKGEPPVLITSNTSNVQTVIDKTSPNVMMLSSDDNIPSTTSTIHTHKVPEIPTLTRKLEEITKERTKQKDLIHDLVMDKLQSKKQLNAEKRLHRSRQRTMVTSGYGSGSSLSPTPKLAAATSTNDSNCTNQAHYHVSTAAIPLDQRPITHRLHTNTSSSLRENNPLQKSETYTSAYDAMTPTRAITYKQRPFSEHLDSVPLDTFELYKLNKTPSFSHVLSSSSKHISNDQQLARNDSTQQSPHEFTTPAMPKHQSRALNADENMHVSTENLRIEARARARLKSNSELGLSPEEKMKLIRKRLYEQNPHAKNVASTGLASAPVQSSKKSSDDIECHRNARDQKMSSSKSVNDLTCIANVPHSHTAEEISSNINTKSVVADFTSDPNIMLSSNSSQSNEKPLKAKSVRRSKDPERRKSLIQSLSSFFHKNAFSSNHNGKDKKYTCGLSANSAAHSAQSERPGTSGSYTTTVSGSADGMFSRFRISPKTKEKSKDKDGYKSPINAINTSTTPATTRISHERSNSQDSILKSDTKYRNNSKHKKPSSSASPMLFSSSSPQLYVVANKTPHYLATNADEQQIPPPIPPLPLNYQRSDDESYATETREQKKQRAISKAVRQAELKRLRIAQEIQREQEEIEVQLKDLEKRGVFIEKALRGEGQNIDNLEPEINIGNSDEKLLKELLEIWRNITQLKKRDEELGIRQQELQLEHRHAQLKEELNLRLSCNKLDKSSADVAAEGAILNEMLEIVAKRAALRPTTSNIDLTTITPTDAPGATSTTTATTTTTSTELGTPTDGVTINARGQSIYNNESNI